MTVSAKWILFVLALLLDFLVHTGSGHSLMRVQFYNYGADTVLQMQDGSAPWQNLVSLSSNGTLYTWNFGVTSSTVNFNLIPSPERRFLGWGGDCSSCGNSTYCHLTSIVGNESCNLTFISIDYYPGLGANITKDQTPLYIAVTLNQNWTNLIKSDVSWRLDSTDWTDEIGQTTSSQSIFHTKLCCPGEHRLYAVYPLYDYVANQYLYDYVDLNITTPIETVTEIETITEIETRTEYVAVGPPTPQLSVIIEGNGTVTGTGYPGSLKCPGKCQANFTGAAVLSAAPAADNYFVSWSKDCRNCGDDSICQIRMAANPKRCIALFSNIDCSVNASRCLSKKDCEDNGWVWSNTGRCLSNKICSYSDLQWCTFEDDCLNAGGYWRDEMCYSKPRCDSEHFYLCVVEIDCKNAGGYWQDSFCYESDCSVNASRCLSKKDCEDNGWVWSNTGRCLSNKICSYSDLQWCTFEDDCLNAGGYWWDKSCHDIECLDWARQQVTNRNFRDIEQMISLALNSNITQLNYKIAMSPGALDKLQYISFDIKRCFAILNLDLFRDIILSALQSLSLNAVIENNTIKINDIVFPVIITGVWYLPEGFKNTASTVSDGRIMLIANNIMLILAPLNNGIASSVPINDGDMVEVSEDGIIRITSSDHKEIYALSFPASVPFVEGEGISYFTDENGYIRTIVPYIEGIDRLLEILNEGCYDGSFDRQTGILTVISPDGVQTQWRPEPYIAFPAFKDILDSIVNKGMIFQTAADGSVVMITEHGRQAIYPVKD